MNVFTLYLMRHGAPVVTGLMLGRTDSDVTKAGVAACREQARDLSPAALVSSDLIRARRCAEAIGEPRIDRRWRELDFGGWDARAPAELDQAAVGRFWKDPDGCPPPGGERWSHLVARVGDAIGALSPVPTLVVTHGGAMRAALAFLCGLEPAATWAFDLPYASVLALNVWEGERRSGQVIGLWR